MMGFIRDDYFVRVFGPYAVRNAEFGLMALTHNLMVVLWRIQEGFYRAGGKRVWSL